MSMLKDVQIGLCAAGHFPPCELLKRPRDGEDVTADQIREALSVSPHSMPDKDLVNDPVGAPFDSYETTDDC